MDYRLCDPDILPQIDQWEWVHGGSMNYLVGGHILEKTSPPLICIRISQSTRFRPQLVLRIRPSACSRRSVPTRSEYGMVSWRCYFARHGIHPHPMESNKVLRVYKKGCRLHQCETVPSAEQPFNIQSSLRFISWDATFPPDRTLSLVLTLSRCGSFFRIIMKQFLFL